jgi:hypothetical protein
VELLAIGERDAREPRWSITCSIGPAKGKNMMKQLIRNYTTYHAAALALALAAGCATEPPGPAVEPAADDTQATEVPASAETTAALGVTSWRYAPTADGVVVRGRASDLSTVVRLWIGPGASSDELIAHATDAGSQAVIQRDGATAGGDAQLAAEARAFRADVEAAPSLGKADATQQVTDHVRFCLGNAGVFSTWAFWRPTYIRIENPTATDSMLFSFAAGASYEENWVPPGGATYARNYWGVAVMIRYIDASPWPGPCPVRLDVE